MRAERFRPRHSAGTEPSGPFVFTVRYCLLNPRSVSSNVAAVRCPGVDQHGAGAVRVVPLSIFIDPAAAQISVLSEAIPDSVDQYPATCRVTSILKLEPFSTLIDAPVIALCSGNILPVCTCCPRAAGAGTASAIVPRTAGNVFSISRPTTG